MEIYYSGRNLNNISIPFGIFSPTVLCLIKSSGNFKKDICHSLPYYFYTYLWAENTYFFWSDSRKCTACRWYDLNLIPLPAPHCRYTFSSSIGTERKIVQRKPAFLPCCISISHFYILYLTENYFFYIVWFAELFSWEEKICTKFDFSSQKFHYHIDANERKHET